MDVSSRKTKFAVLGLVGFYAKVFVLLRHLVFLVLLDGSSFFKCAAYFMRCLLGAAGLIGKLNSVVSSFRVVSGWLSISG
jgi:hypothetical protein